MQNGFDLESCTPVGQGNYRIQLINMGEDQRFDDAFAKAAERWEKIVIGDLRGFPAGMVDDWFGGVFSRPGTAAGGTAVCL